MSNLCSLKPTLIGPHFALPSGIAQLQSRCTGTYWFGFTLTLSLYKIAIFERACRSLFLAVELTCTIDIS